MKKILLFGAGKSATSLIDYLLKETAMRGWELMVAESNLPLAQSKIGTAPNAKAINLNIENEQERESLVQQADMVISLLPPALHFLAAGSCLKYKKDLLTASYLDDRIKLLEQDIRNNGLLFLCEMGLDPGIDHMSAMQLIHRISREGGNIISFRSHTGGLVSPPSDDNPWHYKISWNPRNVVMAGSAGAKYKENDQVITKGYAALFEDCGEVSLDGIGNLAWYPNRDSLSYIPVYGLEGARDFVRTTLRHPDFCRAWKSIVRAGLTNDQVSLKTDHKGEKTFAQWSAPVIPFLNKDNQPLLEFLGVFDPSPIPATARTSADVLQYLLETRLQMRPEDKDMIVMLHEFVYTLPDAGGQAGAGQAGAGVKGGVVARELRSSLIVHGEDHLRTAMAKTVGLPLGIAAMLILEGRIRLKGLHIPILAEIYEPVLNELAMQGVRFREEGGESA